MWTTEESLIHLFKLRLISFIHVQTIFSKQIRTEKESKHTGLAQGPNIDSVVILGFTLVTFFFRILITTEWTPHWSHGSSKFQIGFKML